MSSQDFVSTYNNVTSKHEDLQFLSHPDLNRYSKSVQGGEGLWKAVEKGGKKKDGKGDRNTHLAAYSVFGILSIKDS